MTVIDVDLDRPADLARMNFVSRAEEWRRPDLELVSRDHGCHHELVVLEVDRLRCSSPQKNGPRHF